MPFEKTDLNYEHKAIYEQDRNSLSDFRKNCTEDKKDRITKLNNNSPYKLNQERLVLKPRMTIKDLLKRYLNSSKHEQPIKEITVAAPAVEMQSNFFHRIIDLVKTYLKKLLVMLKIIDVEEEPHLIEEVPIHLTEINPEESAEDQLELKDEKDS